MVAKKEYYCTNCLSTIAESDLRCKSCKSELGPEGSYGLRDVTSRPKKEDCKKHSIVSEKTLKNILKISTVVFFSLLLVLILLRFIIVSIIVDIGIIVIVLLYAIIFLYSLSKLNIEFFNIRPVRDRVPLIIASLIAVISVIGALKEFYSTDSSAFVVGELIGSGLFVVALWFGIFYLLKGIRAGIVWIFSKLKD